MAATSNAVRAGRAFVELFADDKALVRGLKAAQAKLNAFGSAIAKIGAGMTAAGLAIATPMLAAAKAFADVGSNLADMSGRTGVAVEQLSALQYAADQSGTSMESLEKGIRKMQRSVVDAADGGQTSAEAFEALGLSIDQLRGRSPDEQFLTIADALAGVADPTERAARAMDIFGRSGAELLPLMASGATGIRELMTEAQRLGLVMSTEDAVAAEAFGDMLAKAQAIIARTVVSLGAALQPVLARVAELFSGGAASIGEWVNENREMIRVVAAVAAGLVAAGAAVGVVGAAFTALGTVAGIAATGIAAIGAVLGAILSPLGLVTAAAVGGVGAWLVYSEAGQSALAAVGSAFDTFRTIAAGTLGGVVNALAAGELGLAAEVAMAGLNLVWATGWASVAETFGFTVGVIIGAWEQLGAMMHKAWAVVFNNLVNRLAEVGAFIQKFFQETAAEILVLLGIVSRAEADLANKQLGDQRAKALDLIANQFDADRELDNINRVLSDAAAARAAGTSQDIKNAEEALDRARERFAAAIALSRDARAATAGGTATPKVSLAIPDLDEITDKLADATETMLKTESQIPSAMAIGSKEAAEHILRSIAPGNVQETLERQQLERIAEGNRHLQELIRVSENVHRIRVSNMK